MPELRNKQGVPCLSLTMTCILQHWRLQSFSFKARKSRFILSLCSIYANLIHLDPRWERRERSRQNQDLTLSSGHSAVREGRNPGRKTMKFQHLPVVTLRLQSQAAPYLHQEASNFWAIVQCCHQYPWLGRNLLSCFLCGTVILFCRVQRCSVPRNLESLLHETSWHEVGEIWWGPGTSKYPSEQQSSLSWGISKKIKAILD